MFSQKTLDLNLEWIHLEHYVEMILYRWFLSHREEAESLVETHSSESSQP